MRVGSNCPLSKKTDIFLFCSIAHDSFSCIDHHRYTLKHCTYSKVKYVLLVFHIPLSLAIGVPLHLSV